MPHDKSAPAINRSGKPNKRVVLTVAAALAIMMLDAATPIGLAVWFLQVVLVWIATSWASRREIITVAATCSTSIVIGFWLTPVVGPVAWVDQVNVLLSLGTVLILARTCLHRLAAEDVRRKAELELLQSQETVRILTGLLSICAWCKRIRNDEGSWENLEIYVASHSNAQFTHGICRECRTRVESGEYPENLP